MKINSGSVNKLLSLGLAVSALVTIGSVHAAPQPVFRPAFDPALDETKKSMLIGDIERLTGQEIAVAPTSYYKKAFGSEDVVGVIAFLKKRIHFLVPQSASMKERVVIENPGGSPLASNAEASVEAVANTAAGEGVIMAANIGLRLWQIQQAARPLVVKFKIGAHKLNLEKAPSRVGIIQLGEGYSDAFPGFERTATLVHEARHSDCTGGLNQRDLALIKKGEMPIGRTCGHLHVKCPTGHSLAGEYACDGQAWGAYAIESIYAAAVAKTCKNCGEKDKQFATMASLDSFSRVLVAKDMAAGKLGDPDMTSSGVLSN